MQDEIWHQFCIQNYNGNVLSAYSVVMSVLFLYLTGMAHVRVGGYDYD